MSVDTTVASLAWRDGGFVAGERPVPEEAAVAISVNGTTHAVMMATPSDLTDMALGLALNERIVRTPAEVERLDMEAVDGGYDCRLWLVPERAATYVARRRQMTGPVGCGLCGVESLEYATVELPQVQDALAVEPAQIVRAMEDMAEGQILGRHTRAVHAAAFHRTDIGCIVIREDVGRHNALDKVTGHLGAAGIEPALGFLTITSRLSVELVQKAAMMGCELIAAISVPSALALREANRAGITVVAVARGKAFEIFTHPRRIVGAREARP